MTTGYSRVEIALHWLTALFVSVLMVLGVVMVRGDVGFDRLVGLYAWHKSIGLTVFALTLVRLAGWLRRPTPAKSDGGPTWRSAVARSAHAVLLMLTVLLPISGWLAVSASPVPFPTYWLGVVKIPDMPAFAAMAPADRIAAFNRMTLIHAVGAGVLAGVVIAHIVGAFARDRNGDRAIWRMLSRRARP